MPYDVYNRSISDQSISGPVPSGGGVFAGTSTIRVAFAATQQDIAVFSSSGAPAKFRILDVLVNVDTNNASETLTIRDAVGGAGNAFSAALSLNAAGRVREATAPANRTVAAGTSLYFRRNTTVGVGDVIITIQYEA